MLVFAQCLADTFQVLTADNVSEAFYALWSYSSEPPEVRAFPHVKAQLGNPTVWPVQISDIEELRVSAAWSYSSAGEGTASNFSQLNDDGVQANVALDMFADSDAATSTEMQAQQFEIMVWLARVGDHALPIGNSIPLSPPVSEVVDGINL